MHEDAVFVALCADAPAFFHQGAPVCEDPAAALRSRVDYGLGLEADRPETLFVSLYEKEGARMWYLVNSSPEENAVKLSPGVPVLVWHTFTGEVRGEGAFTMPPYSSAFVTEEKR